MLVELQKFKDFLFCVLVIINLLFSFFEFIQLHKLTNLGRVYFYSRASTTIGNFNLRIQVHTLYIIIFCSISLLRVYFKI